MRMLFGLLVGLLLAMPAFGAVIHLNSGESLSGRIQGMDEQTLYLESDRGFGVLKVERVDIRLIEFDAAARNLARKLGIGLNYRPATMEENISLKSWLSTTDALELLVGYEEIGDDTTFSLEGRFSRVFLNEGGQDLFFGAGAGFVSGQDETGDDERGTLFRAFTGAEFFPVTYPNVGLSVELGLRRLQGVGDTQQGFYNALAARYYF